MEGGGWAVNIASVGGRYTSWVQAGTVCGRGAFKGPGAVHLGSGQLPGLSPSKRCGGTLQLPFVRWASEGPPVLPNLAEFFFNSDQMRGILVPRTVLDNVLGIGKVALCKVRCWPSWWGRFRGGNRCKHTIIWHSTVMDGGTPASESTFGDVGGMFLLSTTTGGYPWHLVPGGWGVKCPTMHGMVPHNKEWTHLNITNSWKQAKGLSDDLSVEGSRRKL